jgi:hypothetical protein
MNNMRSKIKYIEKKIEYLVKYRYWICIVLGLLLICVQFRYNEYLAYKKYNNMHGIIIDNYVSTGKYSSCSLPTIKLDDGIIGIINSGYTTYKIGDSYYNKMCFNWVFGMYGTAYFINPCSNYFLTILSLLFLFSFLILSILLIVKLIGQRNKLINNL